MTPARATLAHVASRLAPIGRVSIKFGKVLELDDATVLTVNPSEALVLAPVFEAGRIVLRATNLDPKISAADIAALILARTAGRRAA